MNQRTLLNNWRLDMSYEVVTPEDDPESHEIYITTILKNEKVQENFKRTIRDGEIFQMYFSMKDLSKDDTIKVQVPAPTADQNNDVEEKDVTVPFYENVVCSMQYFDNDEVKTANHDPDKTGLPYPEDKQKMKLKTRQSCGIIPVYKWNSGTYDEVAMYHDDSQQCAVGAECPNCQGSDWEVDLTKTRFEVNWDGDTNTYFEARCTFKRPFKGKNMQNIELY